jgi:hypothetical protein
MKLELKTNNIPADATLDDLLKVYRSIKANEQIVDQRVRRLQKQVEELNKQLYESVPYLAEIRSDKGIVEGAILELNTTFQPEEVGQLPA